jgi:hypothetical protein
MASRELPLSAATSTVRGGLSARAGLRAFRDGGGRVTDSTWFRLVGEARRVLSDRLDETSRPLGRRPVHDEITRVTSARRSGFWQEVEVFWRDRETGEVGSSPFVLRSSGLLTRQSVVDFALGEWQAGSSGSPNPDDHEVLGAAYVSTLELAPEVI